MEPTPFSAQELSVIVRKDRIIQALDHAWSWYCVHNEQRFKTFNFFLIALSFWVVAYAASLTNSQPKPWVGFSIAVAGALFSAVFLALESRNRSLVEVGRDAVDGLEKELADKWKNEGASDRVCQLVHLVREDETPPRPVITYHQFLIPLLESMSVLAFVVAAFIALTQIKEVKSMKVLIPVVLSALVVILIVMLILTGSFLVRRSRRRPKRFRPTQEYQS